MQIKSRANFRGGLDRAKLGIQRALKGCKNVAAPLKAGNRLIVVIMVESFCDPWCRTESPCTDTA